MPKRPISSVLLLIGLLWLMPTSASAAPLQLESSGVFSDTSTLNGMEFGVDRPFTYTAVFDSTLDVSIAPDNGVFAAVITFTIPGVGTFTSGPAGNIVVGLASDGLFGAFIGTGVGGLNKAFGGFFSTATPVFDADTPTPSVLSGFTGPDDAFPVIFPLTNAPGDLVVNGIVTSGTTATISAVPIPSALLLFGTGLLGLIGWNYRRTK